MRNFTLHTALRLLLLTATLVLAAYLFVAPQSYVAAAIAAMTAGFQFAGLMRYVTKTNEDLSRFLHAVRYADFAQSFNAHGRGTSFEDLAQALTEVMNRFRHERAEREANYRYLQTVMQHIGVGLLSFQHDGTVGLINTAAKRLLRVQHLKNIQALQAFSPRLVRVLKSLSSGDKALVQVTDDDVLLQLSLSATTFKMRGEHFTLVSLQDIQAELDEKEVEAWQKLTRVLTHEIMNSITPITSLATSAHELLRDLDPATGAPPDPETWTDVQGAVATIEKRGQNLLHFTSTYRRLTRIPKPNFQIFPAAELFDSVARLLAPQLEAQGVRFVRHIDPPTLDLTADPEMIEQVLINLLKNAGEAVAGQASAEIRLQAQLDGRGRALIQVIDNGPGIEPEALDKIFIPFFTTKPDGSGIGLSLSRQVMRQHGGTLTATSTPDTRTAFTLRF